MKKKAAPKSSAKVEPAAEMLGSKEHQDRLRKLHVELVKLQE